MTNNLKVAYFSMEIGLDTKMPTYAGGLGMLAADLMRSCADLEVNAACMTMCWQHGYMIQKLQEDGSQTYEDRYWKPGDFMKKLEQKVTVRIEGRDVHVGCWQYDLKGASGHIVPIYFLDTNIEENSPEDRNITQYLYGGGHEMRIKQEVVFGIGGVRMLRALGYDKVGTYHMNEGHAAFLTLELLRENKFQDAKVKKLCAFTTHTPVKAGHDAFDYDTAWRIVGDMLPWHIKDLAGQEILSMTELAMNLSKYTCGVAKIHGEVSRKMFPGKKIDHITNGIHHTTWVHPKVGKVLDKYCKGWREDPYILKDMAWQIPDRSLWAAHTAAKKELMDEVNKRTGLGFDHQVLTISTARRVVPYKRPELIYKNIERLVQVAGGKLQIIHSGNANPSDEFSQNVIKNIVELSKKLKDSIKIAYLENYNPDLAKKLISGSDIWLNTPTRLMEASGTSGMKACMNGVLNLSTLDGWWIEGYDMDPESGWRIGPLVNVINEEGFRNIDSEDIYTQLQYEVVPEFYEQPRSLWIERMKKAISLLSYFNTHRAIEEYLQKAWS